MAIIGVDFGGTSIKAGLVERGVIKERIEVATFSSGQMLSYDKLVELIDQLFSKSVKAIGIGFPAVVYDGVIYDGVNVRWNKFPLKDLLKAKFKVPVFVDNDANCFLLAEKEQGCAKGFKNAVGVTLGTGVGTAALVNGKILSGYNGSAGELGRIPWKDGKLEDYCAGTFFKKHGGSRDLAFRAENRDPHALEVFNEFGDNLADLLSIIVNAYDPQVIVIGGGLSTNNLFFKGAMMHRLKKFIPSVSYECLHVHYSTLSDAGIIGAALLAKNG